MLQSIKQLYGGKLGATDGEIGVVKDFYFDDQKWILRYLVADTGTWLTSRQVLLAPHAIGKLFENGKILHAKLTRKQIENSPAIEQHKPVSRQDEEEYYHYYGWPCYWQGEGLWGISGTPIFSMPLQTAPLKKLAPGIQKNDQADPHLRSTQAVKGYRLQASDGIVGHVCDFLVDGQSWAIRQLVVKTGHRFTGKEVLIPVSHVERISYEESTVFVTLTKEAVEQSPVHDPSHFVAAV